MLPGGKLAMLRSAIRMNATRQANQVEVVLTTQDVGHAVVSVPFEVSTLPTIPLWFWCWIVRVISAILSWHVYNVTDGIDDRRWPFAYPTCVFFGVVHHVALMYM